MYFICILYVLSSKKNIFNFSMKNSIFKSPVAIYHIKQFYKIDILYLFPL